MGDVAVECYGRQADRGGGWMAFHGINGVETLQLTPNSVGIWCAELQFVDGKLALVSHKRLDFYNKREKATAEFQKQVEKMKDGTPVLLGIADTACAASRPLGQGVYNTLYKLGAARHGHAVHVTTAGRVDPEEGVPGEEGRRQ